VGKAVKIFLFFPDFVVRYVRFWSRILPILTRQTAWRASAEKAAMSTDFGADFADFAEEYSHEKAQNAQKGQKNDQKKYFFWPSPRTCPRPGRGNGDPES